MVQQQTVNAMSGAAGANVAGGVVELLAKSAPKPASPVTRPAVAKPVTVTRGTGADGLSDDVLTQIAQTKFEAQEDKLRDVTRHTMSLLRDFPKLSQPEVDRRVGDIQKCLFKYEMQTIRAWELQEKRRSIEVKSLESEAERCRRESEEEVGKLAGLRQTWEREKKRRKRYEGYEALAADINKKRTRVEYQAKIDASTAAIARLGKQRQELDALQEARNTRAHLLQHAVAELKADLQVELQKRGEALDGQIGAVGRTKALDGGATPAGRDLVEVIF